MGENRRSILIKWIIGIVLLLLLIGAALYLLQGIGGDLDRSVGAQLFVNGERVAQPAIVYWYTGYDVPMVLLPLDGVAEGLGGQLRLEKDPNSGKYTGEISIRNARYVLERGMLFKEDGALLYDAGLSPHSIQANKKVGTPTVVDQLYFSKEDFIKTFTLFGFHDVKEEVDGVNLLVTVSVN